MNLSYYSPVAETRLVNFQRTKLKRSVLQITPLFKFSTKDADNYKGAGDERMSMECWQNDTGRCKQKYGEENLSQCHFVHHKVYRGLP